jgi:hypothetical protein
MAAEFLPSLWFIWFVSLLSLGISFHCQSPHTPKIISSTLFSTAEATPMKPDIADFPEYTDEQLLAALDSLLEGSNDPSFDGRHLFGFQDSDHKLSKLQTITATRILDYEALLVRQRCWRWGASHSIFIYLATTHMLWLLCLYVGKSIDCVGRNIKSTNARVLEPARGHLRFEKSHSGSESSNGLGSGI